MKRITKVAALAVAGAIGLFPAVTAHADTPSPTISYTCVETVVDKTDKKVLDLDKVSEAIHKLEDSTGADVFLRAYQVTPEGNAAAWWKKTWQECPSMSSPDGKYPSPNILVIEFGLDRTSAIAYGSNWNASLDKVVDRIRSNELNRGLKSGDYTRAVTDTVAALDTAMHGKDPYAVEVDWGAVGAVVTTIGKWLLGIAALAVFVWGSVLAVQAGIRLRRKHLRDARELHDAEQQLMKVREGASNAVIGADPDKLKNDFLIAVGKLPAAEAAGYHDRFDHQIDAVLRWSGTMAELNSLPDPKGIVDVRDRTSEYKYVQASIDTALESVDALIEEISREVTRRLPETVKADLGAAMHDMASVSAKLTIISHRGYDVKDLIGSADSLREEGYKTPSDGMGARRDQVDDFCRRVQRLEERVDMEMEHLELLDDAPKNLRESKDAFYDAASRARKDNKKVSAQRRNMRRIEKEMEDFLQSTKDLGTLADRYEKFTTIHTRVQTCTKYIKLEDRRLNDADAARERAARDAEERAKRQERERNRRRDDSMSTYGTGAAYGAGYAHGSSSRSSSSDYSGGGGSFGSFGGFGGGGFSGGSW
ncbi:MAG: hypothetical protein E6R04_03060 [Spirochaetes bacterium]|nr:MAG: hypothetical protein E6R04_03060 [Spirochaetota bacterium]